MVQGFLDHISSLLHSPEVEVSYFAAGILAHLTSRGKEAWALSPSLRSSLLEQLVGISKLNENSCAYIQLLEMLVFSVMRLCVCAACCHYEVAPARV